MRALVAVRGVAVPDYAGFGGAPMLTVAEVDAEVAPPPLFGERRAPPRARGLVASVGGARGDAAASRCA